ncbi:MAG TPA: hypothetical protein VKB09_02000, partial [Thermomicrobiales bacterium]|nr:hypothetical protein [Thermomicrobiales bacterium]
MDLTDRVDAFNRMVLEDALAEHGLIRHELTFPDRRPITDEMVAYVGEDARRRQAAGQKRHPLAGTAAYAMYEDANYV